MSETKTDFNVVLLHDGMVNKDDQKITSSVTLIDIHDLARSGRTFGVQQTFIAHPSPLMRKLARNLVAHWEEGFGATYNPNRKEALTYVDIVADLDEAIHKIALRCGALPKLVATSAKAGGNRISFKDFKDRLKEDTQPYLMMLGTGWGMGPELLARADLFLDPVLGPGEFNHLSVRSACAIMLDRLFGF